MSLYIAWIKVIVLMKVLVIEKNHHYYTDVHNREENVVIRFIFSTRKPGLPRIAAMVSDLVASGRKVCLNVNKHYEGSAIETIKRIKGFLQLDL
jgi:hypothetical protein